MVASLPRLTRSQGAHIRGLLFDKGVRAQNRSFVVEGTNAVVDLLTRYPDQILAIVTARGYLLRAGRNSQVARLASTMKRYICSDLHFSRLSDLDAPQGILAVVRQPTWDEGNILRQPTVLGVFGEKLQDPANVGAIIRTAAALNVTALWLTPDSVDVYHPKVVRSTSGSLLALPIFIVGDVSGLIRQGCQIYAAEATGNGTIPIDEIRQVSRKLIFAVGNESRGLSVQLRREATTRFTIPLGRGVESLNVAATVAIAAFHFSRLPKGK